MESIIERLKYLYPDQYESVNERVEKLIAAWKPVIHTAYPWIDKQDVMLITYGDGIRKEGETPLHTLKNFLDEELKDCVSAVHLLPMFPFTSDDGFSVSDFRKINPELGDWEDIGDLNENYDLMFDAVINHASKSGLYFQEYLKGMEKYKNFFIEADSSKDYSMVTRPRVLPLLTKFETSSGSKNLWTTFSEDQIDFNYKNPEVLLEILDVLLFYASKGARFIRFDAIGFAWKEDGTTCMHLPQTHQLVKLIRQVLESCAEGCTVITETNVPHRDNISYFGNGSDEAALVYQFPLPPLTLYSFISGNAGKLSLWADSLEPTTENTAYFNFLASHDGIGMRPVEDILDAAERQKMVEAVLERGGQIGKRFLPDGTEAAYELNISYFDAVAGDETDPDNKVKKFMSSQCILLSMMGMPAIYYHSLLGSENCYTDYETSGIKRRINREKLDADLLREELSQPNSLRRKVLDEYRHMIGIRKNEEAFAPNSPQKVLMLDEHIFSLLRGKGTNRILILINVSKNVIELSTEYEGQDLLSGENMTGKVQIPSYGYLWIKLA